MPLNIIEQSPIFEINSNNYEDIYDSLEKFINEYSNSKRTFLIFNTNNIDLTVQDRFVSFVKNRTYKTLDLPDNCKIIVIGDLEKIKKELSGLLTVL